MKILHFLFGFVLYAAFLAASLLLVFAKAAEPCLRESLLAFAGWPVWKFVLLGSGLLALLFLFVLTGLRRTKPPRIIRFRNADGAIAVDIPAVEKYLDEIKSEYAALVRLDSSVAVLDGRVAVALRAGVKEGTQIPELCKMLQARVKEILAEHLGNCDLAGIGVDVDEIRTGRI
jgi:uncharacterized alkaline shock family protein YloU